MIHQDEGIIHRASWLCRVDTWSRVTVCYSSRSHPQWDAHPRVPPVIPEVRGEAFCIQVLPHFQFLPSLGDLPLGLRSLRLSSNAKWDVITRREARGTSGTAWQKPASGHFLGSSSLKGAESEKRLCPGWNNCSLKSLKACRDIS